MPQSEPKKYKNFTQNTSPFPVSSVQDHITSALNPTIAEQICLACAHGRILAEDVSARLSNPPVSVSSVEGYALRDADMRPGAILRVTKTLQVGATLHGQVSSGECVRVFPGSFIPDGANSVVMKENVENPSSNSIKLVGDLEPKRFLDQVATDFSNGEVILKKGTRLQACHLGIATAANQTWVNVHRLPRVAIVPVERHNLRPGDSIHIGGTVNASSSILAPLAEAYGAQVACHAAINNEVDQLEQLITAAKNSELVVAPLGGIVTRYKDLAQRLKSMGLEINTINVSMRPGRPLLFGFVGETPFLALPASPVALFLYALYFMTPMIATLSGWNKKLPATSIAYLAEDLPATDFRLDHLCAKLYRDQNTNYLTASLTSRQDYNTYTALTSSNALIVRRPCSPPAMRGSICEILPINHTHPY